MENTEMNLIKGFYTNGGFFSVCISISALVFYLSETRKNNHVLLIGKVLVWLINLKAWFWDIPFTKFKVLKALCSGKHRTIK